MTPHYDLVCAWCGCSPRAASGRPIWLEGTSFCSTQCQIHAEEEVRRMKLEAVARMEEMLGPHTNPRSHS